jgi:hypothetical protein
LEILTEKQIYEWVAYDSIEPIATSVRFEFMISRLCAVVVNCLRSHKGSSKPVKSIDFMPKWEEGVFKKPMRKQTVEEQKNILQSIASIFGKKKGADKK